MKEKMLKRIKRGEISYIKIFDTLSGEKKVLLPAHIPDVAMYAPVPSDKVLRLVAPPEVRIYVCGITPYDDAHLGHARSAIVFDMIRRWMREKGFSVRYVRNLTDVDDKIIQRAAREGSEWRKIADRYSAGYREDMLALGVEPPDVEPCATAEIERMVRMVAGLIEKGFAYAVGGDVFFDVSRSAGYGRLSRQKPQEMLSGARVEIDERKRSPLDFALWKSSKPGEPAWESPWGPGRPGWHIECSAMSLGYLGETFDLHGGGIDLIFPHHENEIAQSEAYTSKEFVRCWIHHGFVTIDREKMSKSLGNFFTVKEIFAKIPYPPQMTREILRYFLLTTHHRSPVDFSDLALQGAKAGLDNLYIMLQRVIELRDRRLGMRRRKDFWEVVHGFEKRFESAMDDDFNTPKALAELQKIRTDVNIWCDEGFPKDQAGEVMARLKRYGEFFGILQLPPDQWRTAQVPVAEGFEETIDEATLKTLILEREEARGKGEFGRADEVRRRLARSGIFLEDRPDGTTHVRR